MPETWRAQRFRNSAGEIVYDRQREEQKMEQTSKSSGNRREFLEAFLQYNRGFKEHHVGATLKYSQDAYKTTVDVGTDVKNSIAKRHMGIAGRASYNWNYRYFVDFNFGYNGSENFADGHRFGFFPAFSVAWNIAEEKLIKDHLKWMNMFKLRYSYGKVGNDQLGTRFPYLYTISGKYTEKVDDKDVEKIFPGWNWGDYGYDKKFDGMTYSMLASENVTWEIATKHDFGVDLSLFNDKLTATVDYFHEQRDGIYMERKFLPGLVGIVRSNPKANVGSVLSEGFDGHFAYKQKLGKVNLTIRGNMTYSKNEILERDETNTVYPYQLEKGYRVNQAKGLIALGLFKDYDDIRNSPKQQFGKVQPGDIKYKDVNGDGVINSLDERPIGYREDSTPILNFGLNFSFGWKGFDLAFDFTGGAMGSWYQQWEQRNPFHDGGNNPQYYMEDTWRLSDIWDADSELIPGKYPMLLIGNSSHSNYWNSTFWKKNVRYVKLRNLELGYTLPKHIVEKALISDLRFYVAGTNLLTFTNAPGIDPESTEGNGLGYPTTRIINIGVNLKF